MKVITSENVNDFIKNGKLVLKPGYTLAPSACELLRRNKVHVDSSNNESSAEAKLDTSNLAVVTIQGIDKPGIVAGMSTAVAKLNGNITDISQTILSGMFVMVMVVDLSKSPAYETVVTTLKETGESLGVEVSVRLYSIFEAMHRI